MSAASGKCRHSHLTDCQADPQPQLTPTRAIVMPKPILSPAPIVTPMLSPAPIAKPNLSPGHERRTRYDRTAQAARGRGAAAPEGHVPARRLRLRLPRFCLCRRRTRRLRLRPTEVGRVLPLRSLFPRRMCVLGGYPCPCTPTKQNTLRFLVWFVVGPGYFREGPGSPRNTEEWHWVASPAPPGPPVPWSKNLKRILFVGPD